MKGSFSKNRVESVDALALMSATTGQYLIVPPFRSSQGIEFREFAEAGIYTL